MQVKSPTGIRTRPISTVEKLARRFVIQDDGCWQWDKPAHDGYGSFNVGRFGTKGAHRVVWELVKRRDKTRRLVT